MRGKCSGPLHGILIALKNLLHTTGISTSAGMPTHLDFIPKEDATAVARLHEAGCVMLGKLQMTEGALLSITLVCPRPSIHGMQRTELELRPVAAALLLRIFVPVLGTDIRGDVFPFAANELTCLNSTWGESVGIEASSSPQASTMWASWRAVYEMYYLFYRRLQAILPRIRHCCPVSAWRPRGSTIAFAACVSGMMRPGSAMAWTRSFVMVAGRCIDCIDGDQQQLGGALGERS